MAKQKTTFEDAMGRLEEIVESIEQGKIGLEESIKQFETGTVLIQRCRKVLDEAELKIRKLQARGDEDVEVSDDSAGATSAQD